MPLPRPRVIGSPGHLGGFVRGLNIFAPGFAEIPDCAWAWSRGLVSISLMHIFRKEEGLDNAMASLTGSNRGVR
jgi:hypothetical protein